MDIEIDAPIDDLETLDDDLNSLGDGPYSARCSEFTN